MRAVDTLQGTSYTERFSTDASSSSSEEKGIRSGRLHPTAMANRGSARLFLDTADESLWAKHLPLGMYHGVTTNPLLLQRAGVECSVASVARLAKEALEGHGVKEFMAQAWGESTEALVKTGSALAALDAAHQDRLVVKLPLTREGIAAAKILGQGGAATPQKNQPPGGGLGARICMTTCYNREQALVAAAIGAEYVAPYLGRMSERPASHPDRRGISRQAPLVPLVQGPPEPLGGAAAFKVAPVDGVQECAAMQRIIDGMGSRTRVLVASLRSAGQLSALAEMGLDTFTFSPDIADELLCEPLTTSAAADFEAAAAAIGAMPPPL